MASITLVPDKASVKYFKELVNKKTKENLRKISKWIKTREHHLWTISRALFYFL
jgi:hypothetical protein